MFVYDPTFQSLQVFYTSGVMLWGVISFFLISMMAFIVYFFPNSRATFFLEWLYEGAFYFFQEIVWKQAGDFTKLYVSSLFCLILCINIVGVWLDFIAPIFGKTLAGEFILSEYIKSPSSDLQFNLAMALISILILIILQFQNFGGKKFIYSYLPLAGKGYLEISDMKKWYRYYLLFPLVKTADIILSFFLSFLDIIGLFAKIISLSFRLFGNIVSGGALLGMLIIALWDFTQRMSTAIGGINFPVLFPLVLYVQSLLVAGIQAMVFALLVGIFIRVSQLEA